MADIFDEVAGNKTTTDIFDEVAPKPSFMDTVGSTVSGFVKDIFGEYADIPTRFIKGLTWEYAPAIERPKEESLSLHEAVATGAHLAGMGLGLLPVAKVLQAARLMSKVAGIVGGIARGAEIGGIYGIGRKPSEDETRLGNMIKDAAIFGAFGGGGAVIESGLSKIYPEVKTVFEKIGRKEPLTPSEQKIHTAVNYGRSMALGAGAGATEPADTIEERLKNIVTGGLAFGFSHGITEGIVKPFQRKGIQDAIESNKAELSNKLQGIEEPPPTEPPPAGPFTTPEQRQMEIDRQSGLDPYAEIRRRQAEGRQAEIERTMAEEARKEEPRGIYGELISKTKELQPEDAINKISLEEAGKKIAEGDPSVLKHIEEGVGNLGTATMQQNVRDMITKLVADAPKEERPKIRENIAKLEPKINEVLKGVPGGKEDITGIRGIFGEEGRREEKAVEPTLQDLERGKVETATNRILSEQKPVEPTFLDKQGNVQWHKWINSKGYFTGDFYRPEIFGKGGAVEDNKYLRFIARNPKEGKQGYGFDQLAQMAQAEGLIPDAKTETLLEAMRRKDYKTPAIAEEKIAGREVIYPDQLAEGQKVIIKGEEYTKEGKKLIDGEDIEIDPFSKIIVDKVLPKEEQFLKSGEVKKLKPVAPAEPELPIIGKEATQEALKGALPVEKEFKGEEPLFTAKEKAEQRKAEAVMKEKQIGIEEKVKPARKPPEVSGFDREGWTKAWNWLGREGWKYEIDENDKFNVVAPDGVKTILPDVSEMEYQAASVWVLNKGLRDQWVERKQKQVERKAEKQVEIPEEVKKTPEVKEKSITEQSFNLYPEAQEAMKKADLFDKTHELVQGADEKWRIIPKEPISDIWKLTPSQAQAKVEGQINMDLYQRALKEAVEFGLPANKEGLKRYADKGMEWAIKGLESSGETKAKPESKPISNFKAGDIVTLESGTTVEVVKHTDLGTTVQASEGKTKTIKVKEPPQTFREFVESKGKEWPITKNDPDYLNLKAEFDKIPEVTKEKIITSKAKPYTIDSDSMVKLSIGKEKGTFFDETDIKETRTDTSEIKTLRKAFEKEFGRTLKEDSLVEVYLREKGEPLNEIARAFGKKIVFFRETADLNINGNILTEKPDIIYLNINSGEPHLFVLGHELLHTLKVKYPQDYKNLLKNINPLIVNYPAYAEFKKESYQEIAKIKFDEEEIKEDFVADLIGERFLDKEFWKQLHKNNPSTFERIVQTTKDLIDKVINHFKLTETNIITDRFLKDIQKAKDIITDVMTKYAVKEQGEVSLAIAPKAETKPSEATTSKIFESFEIIRKNILPEGSKIALKEEIPYKPEEHQKAIKQWGLGNLDETLSIAGYHKTVEIDGNRFASLIEIATKDFTPDMIQKASFHEAYHSAEELLASAKEMEIIRRNFPTKREISTQERSANAFAEYALDKLGIQKAEKKTLLPQSVKNLYDKIIDFFERIRNAFSGLGYKSVKDIFGDILEGRMKEKAGERGIAVKTEPALMLGKKKTGDITEIKSEFPEVAKRRQEAYGLGKLSNLDRLKENMEKAFKSFKRHFVHLSSKTDGAMIDIFRRAEEIPVYSKHEAIKRIKAILGDIKDYPNKYRLFADSVSYDDMERDIERGMYDKGLPFGYSNKEQFYKDKAKFDSAVNQNHDIKDAKDRRTKYLKGIKQQLVELNIMPESILKDDRYFHHQVLEYMAIKNKGGEYRGLTTGDIRLRKEGWMIARTGSAKDYNTSYLESEFEVVSQAIAQVEKKNTLNELRKFDVSAKLKAEAKEKGIEDWKDLIPKDYRKWQPEKGNYFYRVWSLTEDTLNTLLADADTWSTEKPFNELMAENEVKQALAMGRKKEQWIIPERMYKTIEEFGQSKIEPAIGRFSKKTMNLWKQWTLLNPYRVLKYNLNNLSGDSDIVLAYQPKIILKYGKQATTDLINELRGKITSDKINAELSNAYKKGILSSGLTMQEIPDINEADAFKFISGEKPNLLKRYWNKTKELTMLRENVLRLAAYRYFKEELAKGKQLYGASKVAEIDKVTDLDSKAAKLSRELVGDYGNISEAGLWVRSHLIPFYSWLEINAPRYVRLFKNLRHEGESTKGLSSMMAWKTTKLALKATTMYGAILLWNATFFPQEDDELGRSGQKQLHIILGRNEDGSIRSLRFQGALSDALQWFGLENFPQDFKDVTSGKVPLSKKLKEMYQAPINRIVTSAQPFAKAGYEIATGRALYPDIFKPKPIRDKLEHAFRAVSLDLPYKYIAGKPTKGHEIEGVLLYRADPGESAYYDTLTRIHDYLKDNDYEVPDIIPTKRSNMLYYYKQAKKYGDKDKTEKYLKEYLELGGKRENIYRSIRKSDPLSFLPLQYRAKFMKSLDEEDKQIFKKARDWWKETYITTH